MINGITEHDPFASSGALCVITRAAIENRARTLHLLLVTLNTSRLENSWSQSSSRRDPLRLVQPQNSPEIAIRRVPLLRSRHLATPADRERRHEANAV
jgi:hypothetical protein